MNIVQQSYEIIKEPDIYKKIELVARTCYKSEDRITKTSAKKMVNNLIKNNHLAMLEHASLAFILDKQSYDEIRKIAINRHGYSKYHNVNFYNSKLRYLEFSSFKEIFKMKPVRYMMSGNIRSLLELFSALSVDYYEMPISLYEQLNEYEIFREYLKKYCSHMHIDKTRTSSSKIVTDYSELSHKERMQHERLTVKFITDRGISHELVRHRRCSFAQESTRYCNYSSDKKGMTFIDSLFPKDSKEYELWLDNCSHVERLYNELNETSTPEVCRAILPNCIKTEIVVTTNFEQWSHIFAERVNETTGKVHPQMKQLLEPLYNFLSKDDYYNYALDLEDTLSN